MWKSIQSCPCTPTFVDPERSFLVNHSLDIFAGHWAGGKKRFWYFDVFKSKTWLMLALCYVIRKSEACSTKPVIQNLPPSRFVRPVSITTQNTKGEIADCVLPGSLGFTRSGLYSRIPGIRIGLLGFPGSRLYSWDSWDPIRILRILFTREEHYLL